MSEIDSQQFGFLKLSDDSNVRKKAIVTKAIKYLERFIVRARERQRKAQVKNPEITSVVTTLNYNDNKCSSL